MIFMTKYYPDQISLRRLTLSCYNLKKIFTLSFFAGIIFLVISCEEDPTKIGTGTLPDSDFVTILSTDTISTFSYTLYDNASRSDNATYGYLGSVYNPYFGTTTAEFVSQIRLGSRWYGEDFIVDSVKLYLQFENVTGNVDSEQIMTISEISEQLYTDSTYYSDKPVLLAGYDVSSFQLPALKADTVNNVKIDIPVDFGNYIFRDTSMLFHSNTRADFRSYFKGLYFRMSSSTEPVLLTVNLARSSSNAYFYNYFVIFYHDTDNTLYEYYLILDAVNRNASYNRYIHNFETADPVKKIKHINDGYKDTLSYLQTFSGVYTRIALPGLESIKNNPAYSNIAVNKARLTVPVYMDNSVQVPKTTATNILLTYKADGTNYSVPDYGIDEYHTFYGGVLDTVNKVYNFNIASFMQRYLEDSTDKLKPELDMLIPEGTKNAILKANNSSTPIKFEFTYTKF